MTRRVLLSSLLVLISLYGLYAQRRGTLRTLPNDGPAIDCTGDLACEKEDSFMCMPGDIDTAVTPVLVPTDLRAETVKKCNKNDCSLCVQVTVEISAAFPTEPSEELGSVDCDYDDYIDGEEEEEMEETTAVNVVLKVNNSNNGSLLCAYLIIAHPGLSCYTMRVSLPMSSVPSSLTSNSVVVGSVVYNCISVKPGDDMNISSYSIPRYSKILSITHKVPGCTKLDPRDKIKKCESPVLDFVNKSNETSVGIVNETEGRNITVRVFYYSQTNKTHSKSTITGEMRHYIPPTDIAPCMCIQAWYSNITDAYRSMMCPFRNYSIEKMLRKSRLELKNDKIAVYELKTSCLIEAEVTLCWKSESSAECRAIPNTRAKISSQVTYDIKGLMVAHPSLCVQVSIEGKILHTECFKAKVSRELQNGVVVVENQNRGVSLCRVEGEGCKTLYNTMHQSRIDVDFLDEMLVKDVISKQCVKVLSVDKQQVYVCNVEKYMRSRWIWSRVLCLLVVACILLILLLKIDDLKKWLKSVTADKPLDAIFKNRRVLLLYCPDNPAYEELVRVFALSLQDLNLDVVLDQWHRTDMARVNPLPWYQKQKSEALENQGLIILLFSEGAKEKYAAWEQQKPEQVVDCDPYGSFGAVLNCVYADFKNEQTKGRYLVASFSSNGDVVPDLFRLRQIYTLPSQLVKLLQELAGDNKKTLRKKQAKRLSAKIRDSLQAPLNSCLKILNRQTGISQDGSELSELPGFGGKVAVELEPLV